MHTFPTATCKFEKKNVISVHEIFHKDYRLFDVLIETGK